MAGSFVPISALDVAASLGGVLAVAGLAYRLAHPIGSGASRGGAALQGAAKFAALLGAAGAFWLGGDALILLFAAISALALADFLAEAGARERRLQVTSCFACVPLQFGALAVGRLDLALTVLPIFAMLALPLVALAQSRTPQFVERAATAFWSVMAWVYCLSHVPALLLLGGPAFEARNAGLVAFVAAVALSAQAMLSWRRLRSRPLLWPARAAAMAAAGAMLAWMTPFTASVSALLALAVALAAWAGAFVMTTIRHERKASLHDASALERLALRPDALVFAGPLFFYAVRALLA